MVESFANYESVGFLNKAGEFVFTIKSAEKKPSSKTGEPMWVFEVECDEGKTIIYHSLSIKSRFSLNNLIKSCYNLSKEEIKTYECDYETIGHDLVNQKFLGFVECEAWDKPIKIYLEDGTFENGFETKDTYKIKSYKPVV